jgi:hypothetical protein
MLTLDAVAAEQPDEAVLESISYEKDANNNEKIIFKLNGAHIPKVFKIKGERPRLVFDFLDTRYSDLINRITDTKGSLIQGVRVGIHNDPPKTRVVIDLKPEGDFKFEQDFLIRENTLSITFHPDEPSAGPAAAPVPPPEPAETKPPVQAGKTEPAPPRSEPVKPAPAQPGPESAAGTVQPEVPDPDRVFSSEPPAVAAEPSDIGNAPVTSPAGEPKADLVASIPPPPPVEPTPLPAEQQPMEPVDPVLRDVSFETTADNTEMVLFKLNDFYPPIVFGIEKGNPRVVCDFLDTALDKGVRSLLETGGNYISRIRVAKHSGPDKVRVVLDLVPNRNYDLQQVFFKEDNLFIILINEFEEEAVPAAEITTPAAPKS